LTGIALMTKRLQQRLAASNSEHAAEATDLCALARTAVEWTHDLSRSLSPPVLEREGLAEALRELAANAERILHVTCSFEDRTGRPFREVTAGVHLYRIAQEAISNAVKHGQARKIMIDLSVEKGALLLTVTDDGVGFDPASAEAHGMGLQIMQYRAKMIGATVEVERRNSCGTAVLCCYTLASTDQSE
jgi:signal transduction histidine kinase